MSLNIFKSGSLKTRITIYTLLIFVIGMWSLSFYVSRMLREDMQRILGEQQFSTASYVAADINERLAERLEALRSSASKISPAMMSNSAILQAYIEARPVFLRQFNDGVMVMSADGRVIADSNQPSKRLGGNYGELAHVAAALKEGKSTIGKPHLAHTQASSEFGMATPILNAQGKVIGALVGVTRLDKSSFLDKVTEAHFGKTGGFVLAAPLYGLNVTATNRSRIMAALPAPGVNPMMDRYAQGYEGTDIFVNPLGIEVLASVKKVPVAGWYLAVTMPTQEAFAPIRDMQQRMLWVTILLTLLAGGITWWMLRRQLAPMLAAANALESQAGTNYPLQPLPITSNDEISLLIGGFNRLLETLAQQKIALQEKEERYRTLVEWTPEAIIVHRGGKILFVNPSTLKMFGANSAQDMVGKPVLDLIHPDYRQIVLDRIKKNAIAGIAAPMIEEKFIKLDGTVIDVEVQGTSIVYDGEPAVHAALRDITERRMIEKSLQEQLRFSDALNKITRSIIENDIPSLILDDVVKIILPVLSIDRALIYDIDFDKQQVIGLSEWLNPLYLDITPTKATYPLSMFISGATEIRRTRHWVSSHRDNISPHLQEDGSGEILHNMMMIQSVLWYPFAFRDNGYYLLTLNQIHSDHKWTTEIIDFLDSVAQLVSVALEKMRLVADRQQAEEKLQLSASVFTHAREAILITSHDGTILDVNDSFSSITGYSRDEVIGQNPRILSSGHQGGAFDTTMWNSLLEQGFYSGEVWNKRKNGEVYAQMQTISAVKDVQANVLHYVALFSDISHIKKHEAELTRVANFDALTGIPNRVLLSDRMKQAIAQTSREQNLMAVCYLDLDGFKPINDTFGHDTGDKVLIEITQRIVNAIRGGDTVARLGGDEFVVLLLGLEQGEECVTTLERLLVAIAQPIAVNTQLITVSASIGVSIYPLDDEDPDTLMRHSDQAMYKAKQSGKNRFHIYDPALDRRARDQNDFLKSIHNALALGQFELYYQPKVKLKTQELVGAEALIRWRHPERGLLSPAEFLRQIENTELDIEIGEWVTDSALAQIEHWHRAGLDLEVSINISGYHLESPHFIEHLQQLSKYPELPSGKLQIEVLETVALNDIAIVRGIIETCRTLGVAFALDDFGTGYSSLSYLSSLPVDVLKIDQSFVRDMLVDKGDKAIVQGIIALARAFERQIVAEGIETDEHYRALLKMGCELGQGYGIARPMPADELTNWRPKK